VIGGHQEELDALIREHFPASPQRPEQNGHAVAPNSVSPRGDDEVIEKARARQGGKFERLWQGDLSDYGHDHSVADDAFIHILYSYTQEEEQIRRIHARSGLHRPKKSGRRSDYLQRSIDRASKNVTWFYEWPAVLQLNANRGAKTLSSLSPPKENDNDDRSDECVPGLVCFAHRRLPDPVAFDLEQVMPRGYVTNIHGAGGFGKSVLAMLIAISRAGYQKECLGLKVLKHGKVLYLDSELDERGQHPRVREICKGLEIPVPEGLHYISALGLDSATAFERALRAAKELNITLLVIDSWGPFMDGDMESARDVIRFYNNNLKPFVDLGVTVLIVDHQSRTQEGQSYQKKGAFGSVYKENLARSVLQIERVHEDREKGTLRVRMRHRKSNFGPRREPFDVTIAFGDGRITATPEAIDETEKATEETVSAGDRIKAALKKGRATTKELAEDTGLAIGTVRNHLSALVPNEVGVVEQQGVTKVYALASDLSSLSLPPRENDNDDRPRGANKTPVSFDLQPGEAATVDELTTQREAKRAEGDVLEEFLADPPQWFRDQAADAFRQGSPERLVNALATAVVNELYGGPQRWREALPAVQEWLRRENA
jgi:KaiC/GvpD/RAD55 family RecA-like ATPase